jgi:heme A synthase
MSAAGKLIEAVSTPLGFFGLALLIVESFLGTVLVLANLTNDEKMTGMYIGVGLFVVVMLVVTVLVWCKPQHLTFDKDAHLIERNRAG